MRHPDKFLGQGETVMFDVHHHPAVLLPPLLPVLIVLALWIVGLSFIQFLRGGWAILAGAVLVFILVVVFLSRLAAWSRARLVLTNRRLIYVFGVISKHSAEVTLAAVTDVSYHQGILERLVGMGGITVESLGEPALPYVRLPHPAKLASAVSEEARHASASRASPVSGVSAEELARALKMAQPTSEMPPLPPERPPIYSEIVDQIERLDALRERGTLSEEEFEQAKRDLLSRMGREET